MRLRTLLLAVALFALSSYLARDVYPVKRYDSPLGEQRRVVLEDHSIITLNTASLLEIWGTEPNLHARIVRGEALFEMRPNPNRHLMVSAGDIDVVDLGTTFDVRLADNREIQVLVAEGRVTIYAGGRALYSLHENQEAIVSSNATLQTLYAHNLAPDSVQRLISWQQGVLDFSCESLAAAVAQINRYNLLQIELDGDMTGKVRISGVGFSPTHPILFARTIAATIPNMAWKPVQRPGQNPAIQLHVGSPPPQQCTPHDFRDAPP